MKLYIMRHGTTVWNEKGIIQGHSHNRLSKSGIELVKQSAEKHKNSHFDIIFTSPLMRTRQTTNIMNQYHNTPVIKDNRIIEIGEGIFTRRHKSSLTKEEKFLNDSRDTNSQMETWKELVARLNNFLAYIKTNYNNQNVLIVTHDAPATFLEWIIQGKEIDYNYLYKKNFLNAEVREYNF